MPERIYLNGPTSPRVATPSKGEGWGEGVSILLDRPYWEERGSYRAETLCLPNYLL
jgi:hypothetical protein